MTDDLYIITMTSRDGSPDPAYSVISSTLSSAPATVHLDRTAVELGLHPSTNTDEAFLDSNPPPLAPKTHTTSTGAIYVQLVLQDADRRKKQRTAWYWEHGKEYECQTASNKKGKLTRHWVCNICKPFKQFDASASTHIQSHLKSVHQLWEGARGPRANRSVIELQRHAPQARPQIAQGDTNVILKRTFEAALVAFICCAQIAFSIVENPWFAALLTSVSTFIPLVLPTSHNTVRKWVIESYKQKKETVKAIVARAQSKIHLSFDLWSSPITWQLQLLSRISLMQIGLLAQFC